MQSITWMAVRFDAEAMERAMSIASKKRNLIIWTCLAPLVCGLGCFASRVVAQNAAAPAISRAVSIAASTAHAADWAADEQLRTRVKAALHADPYFYDEHVTVSVEKGVVVLRGFVFSDWDLRDALRIAKQAAGDRPVIDNLSIKVGGRR
jgi:osmotically-inducible protein OsmY